MRKVTRVSGTRVALGAMALLGLTFGGRAMAADSDSQQQGEPSQTSQGTAAPQQGHVTATVGTIDRTNRDLSVQDDSGNRMRLRVPESVQKFDSLKPGDRVSIGYSQPIAVAVNRGEGKFGQPSASAAACARRDGTLEATANVVSVSADRKSFTFRGAGGELQTATPLDSMMGDRVAQLRPGDLVTVTYTEPEVLSITDAPKS